MEKMSDLISREYVLTEYDRQHQGPPGGARKIMEEAPTIDAIPVEWLRKKTRETLMLNERNRIPETIEFLLSEYQHESGSYNA